MNSNGILRQKRLDRDDTNLLQWRIAIIIWLLATSVYATPGPCDDAIRYIEETKELLSHLPPYPGTEAKAASLLADLKKSNPVIAGRLHEITLRSEKRRQQDAGWLECLVTNAHLTDSNYAAWTQFLAGHYINIPFRSPEFVRGAGLHLDINQGPTDLGQSSEAYTFAGRALLSYTFVSKKASTNAGGRVRLLGGVSTYYTDRSFSLLVNARAEFRLTDIGNDLTTFGNIKLIADMNANDDITIYGGGVGAEFHNFGLQLLYQRQNEIHSSHLLLGLFYRFQKRQ